MFWVLLLTCAIPPVALYQFSLHTYCNTKLNMNQRIRAFDSTNGTEHPPFVRHFQVRTITHSIKQLIHSPSLSLSSAAQAEDTSRLFLKHINEYDSEPVLSTFPREYQFTITFVSSFI